MVFLTPIHFPSSAQKPIPQPSDLPSQKPTHFLCIPLGNVINLNDPSNDDYDPSDGPYYFDNTPLTTSLEDLAHHLVRNKDPVPYSAIRPQHTIKLTLGLMSLPTPAAEAAAVELLNKIDFRGIVRDLSWEGRYIPMTGWLHDLHSERQRTSVLYCRLGNKSSSDSDRIGGFLEKVKMRFADAGLMAPEEGEGSVLRVTVVNTAYSGGPRVRARLFDSGDVVRRYSRAVFAEKIKVKCVAICRLEEGRGASTDGWEPVGVRDFGGEWGVDVWYDFQGRAKEMLVAMYVLEFVVKVIWGWGWGWNGYSLFKEGIRFEVLMFLIAGSEMRWGYLWRYLTGVDMDC